MVARLPRCIAGKYNLSAKKRRYSDPLVSVVSDCVFINTVVLRNRDDSPGEKFQIVCSDNFVAKLVKTVNTVSVP